MDKVSYALGIGIGRQLASMGAESLNIDDFAQAVKDAIAGKLQLGEQEAQELVQNFFAEQEAKAQAAAAEKGKVAKEAGEKFLAENGKKDGIITTKSGLQYQVCVKVMARLLRLPIRLSATMRERLSMVLSLTALTTVVRLLPSH